jgi:hypothetical protein
MGLGPEIRDPEKTYSGSRIQGSKRHRIPDPDPHHWVWYRMGPYAGADYNLALSHSRLRSTAVHPHYKVKGVGKVFYWLGTFVFVNRKRESTSKWEVRGGS